MRRTKIVATIGPATSEPDALKALLHAGVDVVRLNAAHGTPEVHAAQAAVARAAAASLNSSVGVLVDLPGPKLRTGPVVGDEVELRMGGLVVLTATAIIGDAHRVSTTIPDLARWVRVGDEVFLADGAIVLCVEKIDGLKAQGKTIIIVTHALGSVRNLCDQAALLEHSQLRRLGPVSEIIDEYLGDVFTDRIAERTLHGVRLVVAGDEEDDSLCRQQRRQRQRDAVDERLEAGRPARHQPLALGELWRAGEERRDVSVGPEAE